MGRMGRRRIRGAGYPLALALLPCWHMAGHAETGQSLLSPPNERPFSAPVQSDPLIEAMDRTVGASLFQAEMAAALRDNSAVDEAQAGEREAAAARVQARSALFPTIDMSLDANRAVARNFSNDIGNIIERSRPEGRTDATASVRQRLLDFGAASSRIQAGNARVDAARLTTWTQGEDIVLRSISAWYAILAQRSMEQLALDYGVRQAALRAAMQRRIIQGYSAQGDLARIDSAIATVRLRLSRFRRERAAAEAQYRALVGHDAPAEMARAPVPSVAGIDAPGLEALVLQAPGVRKAEAQARAARQDARAARAERLPTVSAGVDAGRYGLFENPGDYDVRGRIIVRAQLGAGINARADQAGARADAAEAYAARTRQEALRDAEIALADIRALDDQLVAARASYLATRDSRDVVATRFVASQGSLLDVLTVEDEHFFAAANYVQAVSDLDLAHFMMLARTGRLLNRLSLSIESSDRISQ